ncbi:restriction endonuclease subunit S [Polynucleobacter sp. es-EL-1]|uniref:restriction endonuclease subunit S n=1 Tax=Polynucleobacter sp. es-EL-1 TaxID=1855652 RepID=UPI001BFD5484|nr:restriction endonuclease subunit S [Polynucleobacter sp. es-EL-1]QWE09839.1 restriction endonuclease subunit S [Polynucleobacter sp. es-EL-1]
MTNLIPASEFCLSVFDGTHDTPKPVKEGKLLITSKHISGGVLDSSSAYFISEKDYLSIQKRSAVSQWDILFSMIGSVGEVYLEKNQSIPYAIKNMGVFSCKDENKARWLYYYLISPAAKTHVQRFINGAVQKFLPLSALRNFPVPLYDESKNTIVKVLSTIDEKIECNNRIKVELESMAKFIYNFWFVQFDFPDENGKPYRASGGPMVYNDILKQKIPVGWSNIAIGDILEKSPASTKVLSQDILNTGEIPVIDQGQSYICGFTNEVSALIQPKRPHIIFGDHTRVVKLVNFNYARGADGTQILSSSDNSFPSYVLYQAIANIDLSNYGYARHFKFLKEKMIILPQESISSKYQEIATPIFEKVKNITFENLELTKLRDWLLPLLINGQVTAS